MLYKKKDNKLTEFLKSIPEEPTPEEMWEEIPVPRLSMTPMATFWRKERS